MANYYRFIKALPFGCTERMRALQLWFGTELANVQLWHVFFRGIFFHCCRFQSVPVDSVFGYIFSSLWFRICCFKFENSNHSSSVKVFCHRSCSCCRNHSSRRIFRFCHIWWIHRRTTLWNGLIFGYRFSYSLPVVSFFVLRYLTIWMFCIAFVSY